MPLTEVKRCKIALSRRRACQEAVRITSEAEAEQRGISEEEVLSVLRLWGFQENSSRQRVRPHGAKFVYSDTFGLVSLYTGKVKMSRLTLEYPEFMLFLCRWLKHNYQEEFVYTSISVNSLYCARRHRDLGNVGPSLIKAFGNFEGGRLHYWPYDEATVVQDPADPAPRRLQVRQLDDTAKVTLDVKARIHLFDGRRAHEVEPFIGSERFSLVFYSTRNYRSADCYLRFLREDFDVPLPRSQRMQRVNQCMDVVHERMKRHLRRASRRQLRDTQARLDAARDHRGQDYASVSQSKRARSVEPHGQRQSRDADVDIRAVASADEALDARIHRPHKAPRRTIHEVRSRDHVELQEQQSPREEVVDRDIECTSPVRRRRHHHVEDHTAQHDGSIVKRGSRKFQENLVDLDGESVSSVQRRRRHRDADDGVQNDGSMSRRGSRKSEENLVDFDGESVSSVQRRRRHRASDDGVQNGGSMSRRGSRKSEDRDNDDLARENAQLRRELLSYHQQREEDTVSMLNTLRPHCDVLNRQVLAIKSMRRKMVLTESLDTMLCEIQKAIKHQTRAMTVLTVSCADAMMHATSAQREFRVQS